MKNTTIKSQIIAMLSQQAFVSGQLLSEKLGLTRSTISNHIKALNEMGLDIFAVKGRGYKLAQDIDFLSLDKINAFLQHKHNIGKIHLKSVLGSTNDELKAMKHALSNGSAVLAEAQTKGRGRRGNNWVSPYGASIYLSMLWRFESGYQSIAGLSLLIGIAVRRALAKNACGHAMLKWPNDVYLSDKKVAGILIELEGQVGGLTEVIIGLGVNVKLPSGKLPIGQAYTDLSRESDLTPQRNKVAADLLDNLWTCIEQFEREGLTPFQEEWKSADLFLNKTVKLISGKRETIGICKGINESGALLLELDGQIKTFHGGEISVRANSAS